MERLLRKRSAAREEQGEVMRLKRWLARWLRLLAHRLDPIHADPYDEHKRPMSLSVETSADGKTWEPAITFAPEPWEIIESAPFCLCEHARAYHDSVTKVCLATKCQCQKYREAS